MEYPLKPYLGELILSYFYRLAGIEMVNLILGVFFLLFIYFSIKFIKSISQNISVSNLAFIIFIGSPTVLSFGLIELKVDAIAATLIILAFLKIKDSINNLKYNYLLVPFLLSVSILVKSSLLVLSFLNLIFFIIIIYKFQKENLIEKTILASTSFVFPIIIWTIIYGGTIPRFENTINFKPYFDPVKSITLSRDNTTVNQCYEENIRADYSSFIYGSRTWEVIFQPLFYFTQFKIYNGNNSQPMAIPGIFIYLGIIALILGTLLFKFKEKDFYLKGVIIIAFINCLFFFIFVSSIFWYLLPLFPLFSVLISKLIVNNQLLNKNKYFKSFSLLIIYSIILSQIFYVFLNTYYYIRQANDNFVEEIKSDLAVSNVVKDSLILDVSEHPYLVKHTFIPDWDLRVVKANYYFISSNKNLSEKASELKNNKIKYIILNKNQLDSSLYKDCNKRNNNEIKNFINEYTEKINLEELENVNKILFKII